MDYQQIEDNEYYLKKKYYLLYTLSVLISFCCGFYLNHNICSCRINIENNTFN